MELFNNPRLEELLINATSDSLQSLKVQADGIVNVFKKTID